jgi:glycosidase
VQLNGYDAPDEMVSYDENAGIFTVDASGLENGKYSFLFSISDAQSRSATPVFVPLWIEDTAFDWRDATLYFTMTDRFVDGNAANNQPVSNLTFQTNWQGGDFAGINAKIESGYFDDLGVNVLWISSPIMNTQGAWPGSDGRSYSGYHSYWPISTGWTASTPLESVEAIDPHFGDLDDLKELVQTAHEKGIRVIADFVANHVHTDSPYWQQHRNANPPWFHYVNGSPYVCGWDKPIECWFAEYLPDFEYKNIDVMKTVMDHAIWLIQETNIDGFRLDAVKHMVLDFSTTIRARIDDEIDTVPGIRFYMVGETFTGEGEQSTIAYYVGKNMLDGQFDFPLFWKALKTLVRYESNLFELKNFIEENTDYYGPDSVMSTFLGNHDVPRAISHAVCDIGDLWGNGSKEQAWNNPPAAPAQDWPYKRLQLAWTLLFTQKGIPMIYYGDEIGLPGAGDPDNRRMMIFGNSLNTYQGQTLQHVQKLGKARLAHAALRRGSLQTRTIENDLWAYTLKNGTDGALVVLNRGSVRNLTVSVSGVFDNGTVLKDVVSSSTVTVFGGSAAISIGGGLSAVYVRQ